MNKDLLLKELVKDEGLRLKPYICTSGKLTIGIGRNLDANGISEDEAYYLLNNDIKNSLKELSENFTWFESLSDARQRALINMHFNLGIVRLKKFKKMLTAIGNKDYKEASKQALDSKWAVQVGERAKRISNLILIG